jgi:energy-converting hydrogenase Eha subunit B
MLRAGAHELTLCDAQRPLLLVGPHSGSVLVRQRRAVNGGWFFGSLVGPAVSAAMTPADTRTAMGRVNGGWFFGSLVGPAVGAAMTPADTRTAMGRVNGGWFFGSPPASAGAAAAATQTTAANVVAIFISAFRWSWA